MHNLKKSKSMMTGILAGMFCLAAGDDARSQTFEQATPGAGSLDKASFSTSTPASVKAKDPRELWMIRSSRNMQTNVTTVTWVLVWKVGDLLIAPGGAINSASYIERTAPRLPHGPGFVVVAYSVDRGTQGVTSSEIYAQSTTGNGAAADVYQKGLVPNSAARILFDSGEARFPRTSTYDGNVSSIIHFQADPKQRWPMFFTVIGTSKVGTLTNVRPSDILVQRAKDQQPVVFRTQEQLGLKNGDVIDALCMGNDDREFAIFSLTRTSPSASGYATVRGAGLLTEDPTNPPPVGPGAPPVIWTPAASMELRPASDELNAFNAGDPWHFGNPCSRVQNIAHVFYQQIPQIGKTLHIDVVDTTASRCPGFLLLGAPLPAPIKIMGCELNVIPVLTLALTIDNLGFGTISLPIPNNKSLVGMAASVQAVILAMQLRATEGLVVPIFK